MLYPDIESFRQYATEGNLIPVYREILADLHTPVSAFIRLGEAPAFLLESVEGGEKWARYSFIGLRPSKVIKGRGRTLEIQTAEGVEGIETDNPFEYLKAMMAKYKAIHLPGLPRFCGGLVGYIGYDTVRFVEDIPDTNPDLLGMPDIFLMLTDTMLIFDNLRQKIAVLSAVHTDGTDVDAAYNDAVDKIDGVISMLMEPAELPIGSGPTEATPPEFVSTFGPAEAFESAVVKAKEYIKAGDIFQIVLSQRFERPTTAHPINVYRALRTINPSPYMYYLHTGEGDVIGSSPEILVRLEDGKVILRPIAGTRRRGATEAEDSALAAEMEADPKECAEHIMLVDLGRNDVGRVSSMGSVKVTDMMRVERYSHVMHMVSDVEGDLREGLDAFDVLQACFPAGTVSGAPKVRAMQIIEELETVRRGPYAGAVGYFSYSGNMDMCITIRTLLYKDGKISVQAGAGLVADSVPSLEYKETVNKATGMMRAVDMAERELG